MNWSMLTAEEQLLEIDRLSFDEAVKGVVLFKHSTRCSISSMALARFERSWDLPATEVPVYLLDLIRFRKVSDEIAYRYAVVHESPQVLIIKNGKCIYTASHSDISVPDMIPVLSEEKDS